MAKMTIALTSTVMEMTASVITVATAAEATTAMTAIVTAVETVKPRAAKEMAAAATTAASV